ncbi:MAG: CPBP family intramembrane glutamic endopeptidase [Gemmatimonadales bacterium]
MMRSSAVATLVAAVGVAAAATAAWLFPRALPVVALKQSLTREVALARADSFFRAHSLAPAGARTAVQFRANDSLRLFVELAGGGHDSLNALVRGDDIAPFSWSVRAFVPGNPREAHVYFAPDGRIIGFERKLADTDRLPAVSVDSGQRIAQGVLDTWIDDRADRWALATESYETKKVSGRIDRTYTFERTDRRIAGAPIRLEVGVAGDAPVRVRRYVEIPESFRRRYAEMRSSNDLLALIASLGILAVSIVGIIFLSRCARGRRVRWREPMFVGGVIGALVLAAAINEMPGSWFSYDTAMSPATFQATQVLLAVLLGASTALLAGFTLAAAEAATRRAFPWHLDWWKLWRYRGTREVASRVGSGYAVAAIGFAYVAIFYLMTRKLLGWWVPSELLDDPNLIASPMPWISGIALSLNAGVWEESLFRALPLSLLAFWVGQRPTRRWWLAAGVIVSALIFGFAHANYESWPPYSRGVEIFVDACFWGVLFLNFGLLVTVIAHFVYDLVLFGIFAASGSAIEYRVTAAIIILALLSPAMVVAWRWVRQRGFVAAPEDARFAAWTPIADEKPAPVIPLREVGVFSARARRLALAGLAAGVIVAVARPPRPPLGAAFTADRARVVRTADSMLFIHGGNPAGWTRLTIVGRDTLNAWPRFLREHKLIPEAQRFASTYEPPIWWTVRYVHTLGATPQRTEEWRVRVWPDGRPLDVRHIIPDSAPRGAADSTALRHIALAALAREGIDTSTLQESELKETARPARRDATVTYIDTAVKLPAGAAARAWVQIAGDDPLVARRGIELPEAFLRADRARQTDRMLIAGVSVLLLVGLMIAGAIVVKRRRPIILEDGVLDRRSSFILIGVLILLAALGALNGLPSQLFRYDTAEPWGRFLGTTALGFVVAIPVSLIVLGLWLALSAMRRRVGIPMLAGEPTGPASNDMLIAGLGLGGLSYAVARLDALIPRPGMPHLPGTSLDEAWPVFAGITDMPASILMMVAMAGIPILVIAGLSERWSLRALMIAAIVGVLGVSAWSSGSGNDIDALSVALAIAGVAIVAVALVFWGARSAWSWLVAAAVTQALGGLRNAAYAPVWQERVQGVLAFAIASALIAIMAHITRRPAPAPADAPLTQV